MSMTLLNILAIITSIATSAIAFAQYTKIRRLRKEDLYNERLEEIEKHVIRHSGPAWRKWNTLFDYRDDAKIKMMWMEKEIEDLKRQVETQQSRLRELELRDRK